ncbi:MULTISPECIES: CPBP family intramembrane glutamic endopeptidase [Candidatus Saccharibacteria]|nr:MULTISPECIES: CPBP family intramembrane glutamic endopeptidase [Candidatus Saccharibacteria]QWQ31297.1 CPBP family intramembrane metalloprotease [Candidatus Minimicrobia vallesae]
MKFATLVVGAVAMYIVMRILGNTHSDIGITRQHTIYSLRTVLPITIALIIAAGLFLLLEKPRFSPTEGIGFYVFYIFISCPAQELLFRGILSRMLQELRLHRVLELGVAAALFGYAHIIYGDMLTVVVMSIVGLLWYRAYQCSSNLIGVTISHVVLGVMTIALGIID